MKGIRWENVNHPGVVHGLRFKDHVAPDVVAMDTITGAVSLTVITPLNPKAHNLLGRTLPG